MELTDNIRAVLKFYSSLGKSEAFCKLKHYNGNTEEYIYSRLERAAFDQRDGNNVATFSRYAISVSYTHLRAHETPEHLVCRLLLEKKNKKKQTQITNLIHAINILYI